jgi:hypothetical protein
MGSEYPSLRYSPTVEGCAYNAAFAVVVYLQHCPLDACDNSSKETGFHLGAAIWACR